MKNWFPKFLFALYLVEFVVCAINPYSRDVWWVENIPIFTIAILLAIFYVRGVVFSNVSYLLMGILLFWHTIGGHYTFERVPFEWFSNLFGFERNMFDRVGHFTVGFYAYPIAEILFRRNLVTNRFLLWTYPVFAIATVAMSYELIEWIYAVTAGDPSSGVAFLGSQGDIWDAQKDMLMDTLGAIFSATIFLLFVRRGK
jgi:putative membrane protein